MDNKYNIFSDESGQDGSNRYACLAAISGSNENTKKLNEELKSILELKNKKELKFKEIKNNRTIEIAKQFLNSCFVYLRKGDVKLHVLLWDKQDSRHEVQNRCDIENLKFMYYKLLRIIVSHWQREIDWHFFPDEHTAIDWKKDIVEYLKFSQIDKIKNDQSDLFASLYNPYFANFMTVNELDSKEYPVVQLADLFAGIIRTSRNEEQFYKWHIENKEKQPVLFELEKTVEVSKSMLPKFEVMNHFKSCCDAGKFGVSLSKSGYFETFNKKNNIFIMHYEPQHELDKAPTKK